MRDDRQWAAVIAELEENSWFAHKEQAAAAFKSKLSTLSRGGTRLLPASVARRLLACFSPLVGWLTSTTCSACKIAVVCNHYKISHILCVMLVSVTVSHK